MGCGASGINTKNGNRRTGHDAASAIRLRDGADFYHIVNRTGHDGLDRRGGAAKRHVTTERIGGVEGVVRSWAVNFRIAALDGIAVECVVADDQGGDNTIDGTTWSNTVAQRIGTQRIGVGSR